MRPVRLAYACQSMSGVGQQFLMRFEQSRPAHKHIPLHALNGRRCETSEAHRGSRLEGRPCSPSTANVQEQQLGSMKELSTSEHPVYYYVSLISRAPNCKRRAKKRTEIVTLDVVPIVHLHHDIWTSTYGQIIQPFARSRSGDASGRTSPWQDQTLLCGGINRW